ncbi:MAG: hypothetical protein L3J68_02045 [Thermoplasmata archaeon]|nr:hypothetical protein [Thermoplasmata archaeon]
MSPPPAPRPSPISAPDLTGPTSILEWPIASAGPGKARRARPFGHLRLELDLRHERLSEPEIPVLRQFERLLRERSVVEPTDLLRLGAAALHAFSVRGFSRVDHWEIEPGGWLPLPEPTHQSLAEPVSHLVRALQSDAWRRLALAREFSVRLSGHPKMRADLVVRRIHRERGHSITVDLRGWIAARELDGLVRALRERLPVLRSSVTQFAYRAE